MLVNIKLIGKMRSGTEILLVSNKFSKYDKWDNNSFIGKERYKSSHAVTSQ